MLSKKRSTGCSKELGRRPVWVKKVLDILHGIIAMHLRCGATFVDDLTYLIFGRRLR